MRSSSIAATVTPARDYSSSGDAWRTSPSTTTKSGSVRAYWVRIPGFSPSTKVGTWGGQSAEPQWPQDRLFLERNPHSARPHGHSGELRPDRPKKEPEDRQAQARADLPPLSPA